MQPPGETAPLARPRSCPPLAAPGWSNYQLDAERGGLAGGAGAAAVTLGRRRVTAVHDLTGAWIGAMARRTLVPPAPRLVGVRPWVQRSGNPTGSVKRAGLSLAAIGRGAGRPGGSSRGRQRRPWPWPPRRGRRPAARWRCRMTRAIVMSRCGCTAPGADGPRPLVDAALRLAELAYPSAPIWDSRPQGALPRRGKRPWGSSCGAIGGELPDWILYPTRGGHRHRGHVEVVRLVAAPRPDRGDRAAMLWEMALRRRSCALSKLAPPPPARGRAADAGLGFRVPRALGDFLILRALRDPAAPHGGFAVARLQRQRPRRSARRACSRPGGGGGVRGVRGRLRRGESGPASAW